MLTKNRRLNVALILALIALMIVPSLTRVSAADPVKKLTIATGKGDIPTADPALVTDTSSAQVALETHYPLVRGLETDLSQIKKGIADSWKISADGLTYTFTLRKDVPWVMWDGKAVAEVKGTDGKPLMVTAKDFEYGIKRTLNPATASEYAYVFNSIIKGAEEYNGSKETGDKLQALADAVGVKATNDTTLVITLKEPAGYALGILALPNASAQPQAAIEKSGDKWTEPGNAYSYGPYVISEWKHDESMTLTKNPFWPGVENSPKPKIDQVVMLMIDTDAAFNNYEAGTVDTVGVSGANLDRVKGDATLKKELKGGPNFATYYYGFNVTKAPFDNVHMRRAFSYAVDRQSLIDNVLKGDQEPARWMSRPGIAAAPTMKDSPKLGIGYDPEAAKKELQAYLDEKKITADQVPPITLVVNQVQGHVQIAEAIQQMWQDTLGVKVELTQQEWKVYLKTLQTDSPQVWRLGWNLDYPDANNFLRDVFYSTSSHNYTKWSNKEFDKIVDDAAKLTDNAKRLALYRQAEDILVVKEAAMIPIYWYGRSTVTKPYVTRTFSVGADERFENWDIKAH